MQETVLKETDVRSQAKVKNIERKASEAKYRNAISFARIQVSSPFLFFPSSYDRHSQRQTAPSSDGEGKDWQEVCRQQQQETSFLFGFQWFPFNKKYNKECHRKEI